MFQPMFQRINNFFLVCLTFIALVLVTLLASSIAVYAQAKDPLLVILAFNDAVNAHDVDAALAFFADDAVATVGGPPPNVGKEQIRTWLQADIADNIHVESRNYQVVGDKVTWIGKVSVDSLRNIGVSFIEGPAEAVVQGGKIKSFTYILNQESLAKLEAFPVIVAFHAAYNAHDMDATLALFADDAVMNFPGQPPPNVLTGKEQIRTAFSLGDFAYNVHQVLLVESLKVVGGKVTWSAKGSADFLQKLGIASLDAMGEAVIQEGKIKSFTAIFPPESLAKLNAATLITALQEGANAHKDIDAMVNFFTDDAVVTFAGQPPPNVTTGKEEIRAWQQMEFAWNSHIKCENLKVAGDKVTWTLKYSSDPLLKLDVVPPLLESTVEAVIQEGKFKSFTVTFNQESLAKLNAALLITALQEGANAHKDIDAMVNLFTDDAVVSFPNLPGVGPFAGGVGPFTGKDEIRMWQQMEFATESHIECSNLQVAGDKLTWTLKVSENDLREIGIDSIDGTVEAVVQEGKFKSFTYTLNPESLAYLECAIARTEEDFSHVFFMSLSSGLNMVSLPLKPQTPYTARSFAEMLSATVVIKLDEKRQRFVGFTLDAPDDGFAIEGGKGYIVNVPEAKQVAFVGAAWTNQPPVEAVPSLAQSDGAWAFVVSGRLDGGQADSLSYVTVRNTRTNAVATDVVRSGYFAVAFANLSRQSVVEIGDQLEVTVMDRTGEIVSDTLSYTVTPEAIHQALLPITLTNVGKPNQSRLMQNYPNPFNPETWIPYQLREPADVVIRIYDATGQLVRTLSLGQRAAGFYLGRHRAASWDGHNEAGEKVASGIYFYQLQAGDFSAMRKMVVVK